MEIEKKKSLDDAISLIEKQFGKGTVLQGNQKIDVPLLCGTGSLKLDCALGIGGIPRGRSIEIFGKESSGKTTLSLSIIAEVQKKGGSCVYIDAEHALDLTYAQKLGVNTNDIYIVQPECAEEAFEVVEKFVDSHSIDIIIVDSVAALVPRAEIEGEAGQSHMGLQARLMSQALRKLTGKVAKAGCSVIFINQLRDKIGQLWGDKSVTTGGNALKFYASIRMDMRRLAGDSIVDEEIGQSVAGIKVKIVKNKCATPFKVTHLELETGVDDKYGFNIYNEVVDLAVDKKIIDKSGSWFNYGDIKIGQGKKNVNTYFLENPEVYNEIKAKLINIILSQESPEIGSFRDVIQKNEKNFDVVVEEDVKKRGRKPKGGEDKDGDKGEEGRSEK